MAKGNEIIITVAPRGIFLEGYVNAALKPGTVVQPDVSEGIGDDGRLDWEAYDPGIAQNGARRLIAVLLPDQLKGKLATDAYVSGDRCFIYVPIAGEELNMLVTNLAGTADDHSLGDLLMVGQGTGTLLASAGSPESEPFILMEAIH
jgi:hypothetical protein